jgi:hypothetical protein
VRPKDFDCDSAFEPRVTRSVDLAHPARAERRDDLVGAEAGAGRETHVPIILLEAECEEERFAKLVHALRAQNRDQCADFGFAYRLNVIEIRSAIAR